MRNKRLLQKWTLQKRFALLFQRDLTDWQKLQDSRPDSEDAMAVKFQSLIIIIEITFEFMTSSFRFLQGIVEEFPTDVSCGPWIAR